MMKKIFKWILRILLFLFLISLVGGVYFYFFPVYPNYGISEEYFETRFHEQGFDSPGNGYEIWSNIQGSFTGIQGQVDAYSRCYVEKGGCSNGILPEINDNNKQQVLSDFLESDSYSNEYLQLVEDILKSFEEMLSYDYISTLDYNDYKKLVMGEETKEVLTFTSLIQFSRSLGLFYDNSSNRDYIRVFGSFYKSLSSLSYKLDSGLVDYLVIITILNTQFDYLENNINRFNDGERQLLLNILNEYDISDTMIQNAGKAEYWEGKILFENLFSNSVKSRGLKSILFYGSDDTMNLLRKNHYNKINNICEENWPKKNGRNFLGRILIQGNSTCYSSQYIKQKDLLQKREELIQLLSN